MVYKYCENRNFEDLASGKVIVHKAGYPNFPVRLAQETTIIAACLGEMSEVSNNVIGYETFSLDCCFSHLLKSVEFLIQSSSLTPRPLRIRSSNTASSQTTAR